MTQEYDPLYDERLAMVGEIPFNHAPPPPVRKLVKFDQKKTLGQVAMEADRQNVIGDPRMVKMKYFDRGGHVPTWMELTPYAQDQWERFALSIARAIVNQFPEEIRQMREVVEVEQKRLSTGKVLELPNA